MSIDYSTYVGPYVRCVAQSYTHTRQRRSCPNPGCPNHGAYMPAGFCPTCGTAVAPVSFPEQEFAVDAGKLQEAIGGRLVDANGDAYWRWSREQGVHLWTPNVGWGCLRKCHLESREDFNLQEIAPELIQAELHQFEVFFAADISTLRTAYGEAAVSIRWGVIQDYY